MANQLQKMSPLQVWSQVVSLGLVIGLAPVLAIALATPSPRPSPTARPASPAKLVPNPLSTASRNENRPRFREILDRVASRDRPQANALGTVLQRLGLEFLGSPYTAGLLDRTVDERLVVNLQQFDCLTLVETVLALGRSILAAPPQAEATQYQSFGTQLETLRYRSGKRQDYCSRLHYFADWVSDNQRRGLVRNLTPDLGGLPLVMSFNFMTQHRSLYPALADNAAYTCLQRVETALNSQRHSYLPTAAIRSQYSQLQSGDIIAVATRVRGLDVTHVGLVYRDRGQVGLIHAAPGSGVKLSPDLERYVSRVEDSIGIMVARPVEPR
jgi:cell wall-associated NlpC family hydrolase